MTDGILQSWLAHFCQFTGGVRRGVVYVRPERDDEQGTTVCWPPENAGRDLVEPAQLALADDQAIVRQITPRGAGPVSMSVVAVPFGGEGLHGALVVEVAHARRWDSEPSCKEVVDQLQSVAVWLERFLRDAQGRTQLSLALQVVAAGLEPEGLRDAATAIATELAISLHCERVSVGVIERGRMRVEAVSHSADFDPRSQLISDMSRAMEEACDQEAVLTCPFPADAPPRVVVAHQALARQQGAAAICTVPLASRGRMLGALLLEHGSPDAWDARAISSCESSALLVGSLLELQRTSGEGLPAHTARAMRGKLRKFTGPGSAGRKVMAAVIGALAIALFTATGTYRVRSDATIEGRIQRAVVAGFEGYIAEAHARAGDVVTSNQLLARLDSRDLLLEKRQSTGRHAQLSREHREALATNDRSRVNVLRAQIEQAAAQLALVDEQLARTYLLAPYDGVVVKGDLSQSLGSPVSRGDVLFEIAPLDGYRIFLAVDERDIADIRPGQRGALTLAALPNQELELTVERVVPISVDHGGRNVFRVEGKLDAPVEGLRPGMEGVGKVGIDERRWIEIWTRGLVHWLRLSTWAWWS